MAIIVALYHDVLFFRPSLLHLTAAAMRYFFLRSVEIAVCGPCALEECKKKTRKKQRSFLFFSSQQNKRSESGSSVCRRHYREALEQKAQRSGFHRALGARKPLSLNGHEDQDG